MMLPADQLVTARDVGDGRYVLDAHERDFMDRLRNGDATVGWTGDERLSLVANVELQRMEIWRAHPDGLRQRVCWRAGLHMPGPDLLVKLRDIDNRHVDVVAAVDAHNEQVERHRQADADAEVAEIADRLHFEIARAINEPAADGRVVGGGKRWR